MGKYELYDPNSPERHMDNATAHAEILKYENLADSLFLSKQITKEQAWDLYFCLAHECNSRNFTEDFDRIVAKIDVKKYRPLTSQNPLVAMLARIRLRIAGKIDQN